jgi:hypothetical protein
MKKLLPLAMIMIVISFAFAEPINMSVLVKPYDESVSVEKSELTDLKNKIIVELMNYQDKIMVIDNEQLKGLQEELYKKVDETTQDDIYNYGQIANASILLIASYKKSGSFSVEYTIDLALVEAATGKNRAKVNETGKDFVALISQTIKKLILGFTYEKINVAVNIRPDIFILNGKRITGQEELVEYAGAGEANLRLEKSGYRAIDTSWIAEAGNARNFNFQLMTTGASVQIDGTPKNMKIVFKNSAGAIFGKGIPFEKHVKAGMYTMILSSPGYEKVEQKVTISDGNPLIKRYNLPQKPLTPMLIYNTILPGAGHIAYGYYGKGALYSLSALAGWGSLAYFGIQYQQLDDEILNFQSQSKDLSLSNFQRNNAQQSYNNKIDEQKTVSLYIYSAAGLLILDYGWTMFDSWLTHQSGKNNRRIAMGFQLDQLNKGAGAYASVAF